MNHSGHIAGWIVAWIAYLFLIPYGLQLLRGINESLADILSVAWFILLLMIPLFLFSRWTARSGGAGWAKRSAKVGLLLWLILAVAYPFLHFGPRVEGWGNRIRDLFIVAIFLAPFALSLCTFLLFGLWIFAHPHPRWWVNAIRYLLVSFFSFIVFMILLIGAAPYTP